MFNVFKPHVVRFVDGTFGIRRLSLFWFGWVFFDLKNNNFWWRKKQYPNDTCGTAEEVLAAWRVLSDKGTPVKLGEK